MSFPRDEGLFIMSENITLFIDNQRFQFWENIDLTFTLDSIDNFTFTSILETDNLKIVKSLKPLTYAPVKVKLNNETILDGNLNSKSVSIAGKTISFAGYSKPGILSDLTVPFDKFPLEFKEQTLFQIASELASYYNIEVNSPSSVTAAFSPTVSPDPGEKILDFIIKLAKKREFLVSNTIDGKLNFLVPGESKIITSLEQGKIPLLDARVDYNEQEIYSSVTGLGASQFGRAPESFTVKHPALSSINRPFVYTVSEVEGADLEKAVRFKAGRLFAETIPITAEVDSWRGINNKIWQPGDFVTLLADNVFFYKTAKLMIKNVSLHRDATNETASLSLVFPGVYSGELPKKLPWD